jgi:hypothetical protein
MAFDPSEIPQEVLLGDLIHKKSITTAIVEIGGIDEGHWPVLLSDLAASMVLISPSRDLQSNQMVDSEALRADWEARPGKSLLPAEVEIYLSAVADRTASVLGDMHVGTYLHGSAVLGAFNPTRSDLDVLVVARGSLFAEQKAAMGEKLSSQSLPVPAETLELSVVTLETVRNPTEAPEYELHINTRDSKAVDGRGHADPDLTLHFPVARQSGRLLGAGSPPAQVFAHVAHYLVLAGMIKELHDATDGETAAPEYLVLNACRNLAYASDGIFYSKVAGGEWVLSHHPDIDGSLVSGAIQRQIGSGTAVPPIDRSVAKQMALDVADRLYRAEIAERLRPS